MSDNVMEQVLVATRTIHSEFQAACEALQDVEAQRRKALDEMNALVDEADAISLELKKQEEDAVTMTLTLMDERDQRAYVEKECELLAPKVEALRLELERQRTGRQQGRRGFCAFVDGAAAIQSEDGTIACQCDAQIINVRYWDVVAATGKAKQRVVDLQQEVEDATTQLETLRRANEQCSSELMARTDDCDAIICQITEEDRSNTSKRRKIRAVRTGLLAAIAQEETLRATRNELRAKRERHEPARRVAGAGKMRSASDVFKENSLGKTCQGWGTRPRHGKGGTRRGAAAPKKGRGARQFTFSSDDEEPDSDMDDFVCS